MTVESEQRVLREVIIDQLDIGETRAYRMWLPPLSDPTPVNELIERRDHIARELAAQGWRILQAQGNFVWLPTGEQTTAVAEALEAGGIVARVFPPEGIRVSIGEPESVEKLLRVTAEVVGTLREVPENTRLG